MTVLESKQIILIDGEQGKDLDFLLSEKQRVDALISDLELKKKEIAKKIIEETLKKQVGKYQTLKTKFNLIEQLSGEKISVKDIQAFNIAMYETLKKNGLINETKFFKITSIKPI